LVAVRAKQTKERRLGRPLARSAGALIALAKVAEQPPEKQRHNHPAEGLLRVRRLAWMGMNFAPIGTSCDE
jgi:hypothetical protein